MDIEEFRDVRVSKSAIDEYYTLVNSAGPGLKLEFGVYRGGTINKIATFCPNETVWGFDSFTGTPDHWEKGGPSPTRMSKFNLEGTLPDVEPNVKLVKGMFQDVLPGWWAEHRAPIGVLNIDSDLYESAIFVLRTLNDGIVPGTLVRFDELCDFRNMFDGGKSKYSNWRDGEWRALNEWTEEFHREVFAVGRSRAQCGTIRVTV